MPSKVHGRVPSLSKTNTLAKDRLGFFIPIHSAWVIVGISFLSACSALPGSAPTEEQVLTATQNKFNPLGYEVLAVTPDVADILDSEQPPLVSTLDRAGKHLISNDRIGPGDMLGITIFELGNGLFAPMDRGLAAGSNGAGSGPPQVSYQTLPATQVEADGTISIPYVGSLHVAGMTPQALGRLIQQKLGGKSQNPQVMVRITVPMANTVVVSGEVKKPGRVVLSLAQERLSDLIAISGGATKPPNDSLVELVRGTRTGMTDLGTLESHPQEDIRALPGDRVRVIYQPRSFTAFGAVGMSQTKLEVPFNTATLTLAEALARIGGASDSRADPNAVFLFRYEDPVAAAQLHLDTPPTSKGIPVVYQLDLMNPTDYFLAQRFPVKNHDVILIGDAKTNRLYKMNQLIGTVLAPAVQGGLYAR